MNADTTRLVFGALHVQPSQTPKEVGMVTDDISVVRLAKDMFLKNSPHSTHSSSYDDMHAATPYGAQNF